MHDFDERLSERHAKFDREVNRTKRLIVIGRVVGSALACAMLGAVGYGAVRILTNLGLW